MPGPGPIVPADARPVRPRDDANFDQAHRNVTALVDGEYGANANTVARARRDLTAMDNPNLPRDVRERARDRIRDLGNRMGGAAAGQEGHVAEEFYARERNIPPSDQDVARMERAEGARRAGGAGGAGGARGAGAGGLNLRQILPLLMLGAMMGGGPMGMVLMQAMLMQTLAQARKDNEKFCRDQMQGMNPNQRIAFMRAFTGAPAA